MTRRQVGNASKSLATQLHQVSLVCVVFISALYVGLGQSCSAQEPRSKSTGNPLRNVAALLGRSVENLRLLDGRPLVFAFLKGEYKTFVVRDLTTDETVEIALDLKLGRRIDPAELRKRDRERAAVEGRKLEPELLDLLLRHPDLSQMDVLLFFSLELVQPSKKPPQRDWLEPDLREEFQTRLDAELRQFGINVPLRVRPDFPILEATLSAPEIVKLGGSPLIKSIALVAEPVIPDK